ncbi:MAG TPA: LCP family protein [Candidatus Andersenbacteria bacterium]|nr:LCP family protein [Candidatus Andersenbacteria bacterium]
MMKSPCWQVWQTCIMMSQDMEPQNIDQIPSHKKHSKPFRIVRGLVIACVIAVLAGAGIFGYKILAAGNSISTANQTLFGQLSDLLFKSGNKLKGEQDDRINILLIAIGGEGHDGANLADTIMVASIEPKEKKIALLSIPRDLYVQVPGQQFYSKLNAVHAYGEAEKKNGGPALLEQKVEEITGLKMDYFARVDFTAFKKIVDAVGGVNIHISNGFFDYWHKIAFPTGTETMNGDRALAYVRARYVEGPEGGDFKRTARQQQMLVAIRDKVFSVHTALDFNAINGIFSGLSENIKTDMQLWEMKRFFELARQIDPSNIKSDVMSTGPNGILKGDTVMLGGVPASVLKTRTGDFSEIKTLAQNMFSTTTGNTIDAQATAVPTQNIDANGDIIPSISPSPSISPEVTASPSPVTLPTLEVRNGTNTTGLAKKIATKLEGLGYKVIATANASSKTITATKVYAPKVTQSDDAEKIASALNASAATDIPSSEAKTKADILIILGSDAVQ